MSLNLFEKHTIDEHATSIASYMPQGDATVAGFINGSNTRSLYRGFAGELKRAEDLLIGYVSNYFIDDTVDFIEEWESAVGIPDECFSGTDTLENRRRDILTKLASLGVQTAEDFENVAAIFGFTITIIAGADSGITFPTVKEEKNTIVLQIVQDETFTYTFPIPFGDPRQAFLECLFANLIPATSQLIVQGT